MRFVKWSILAALALALPLVAARVGAQAPAAKHKVAIQINENNPATMNLALNNVMNIVNYYKKKNETVAIEVIAYGPGLHMYREDTSPVKQRVAQMSLENANVAFMACGNTQENMSKQENKKVSLVSEAKMTPSGVIRLMELQGKGWAYIRP